GELVIVFTGDHLICGGFNGLCLIVANNTQFVIGNRTRFLDEAQRVDMGGFKTFARNREIFYGTLGLCGVQCLQRYSDFTHGVMFNTELLIIRLRCHNPYPSWELPSLMLISALVKSVGSTVRLHLKYRQSGRCHWKGNRLYP